MAYNPSTKKITAPVSVHDIQQALGKTSKDVKNLCLQTNVNMLSKFKPTSARGIFVHDDEDKWWQGMSVGQGEDTPQHELFYTGMDYAGIYKPYMVINDSNLKPGGYILNSMLISDVFLNNQWKHSIINRQSLLPSDTAGRVLDFKNYIHTDKKRNDVPWEYPSDGTDNILKVTNNFHYSSGDTFDISCLFNFALSTQIEGSAALLGMCDIFGRNNLSGKAYYGIIVMGEQLSNRGRLTLIYISGKGIGDSNDDTSGGTGLSYCTNITIPTGDFLDQHDKSTAASGSKKFYRKEQITIIPIIARQGLNQNWYISNLNLYRNGSNKIYSTVTIPDYQAADISMFYFSNMSIDIAYYKDTDNNSVFEVNGGNALRFVVKNLNPNASSSTLGDITFAAPWKLMIGPADGNTASLNVKEGTVGDGSSHKIKDVTDGQTITQTSAIISDYSSTNCPYLKLKPLDGVTEFKVSITFSYYRPVKGANDTYSMHKFMATATQSFNPSSINTTRQTREFIFSQKDLETQSDTSEYMYCLGTDPGQPGGGSGSSPALTLSWEGKRYTSKMYSNFYSYKVKKVGGGTPIPVPFNFSVPGFQSICSLKGDTVSVVDGTIKSNAMIGAVAILNNNVQVGQTYSVVAAVTQPEAGSNLTFFVRLTFKLTS